MYLLRALRPGAGDGPVLRCCGAVEPRPAKGPTRPQELLSPPAPFSPLASLASEALRSHRAFSWPPGAQRTVRRDPPAIKMKSPYLKPSYERFLFPGPFESSYPRCPGAVVASERANRTRAMAGIGRHNMPAVPTTWSTITWPDHPEATRKTTNQLAFAPPEDIGRYNTSARPPPWPEASPQRHLCAP